MSVLDGRELLLGCCRLLDDGRTEDTHVSFVYFLLDLLRGESIVCNSDVFGQRFLGLLSEFNLKASEVSLVQSKEEAVLST